MSVISLKQKNISSTWQNIGTIIGDTNIDGYKFYLKQFKAKKGDIIATEAQIPSGNGNVINVIVWGRIADIYSYNDFLPNEATKALTEKEINIEDTILPMTTNDAICIVKNIGYTTSRNYLNDNYDLRPMNYPVLTGTSVKYPATEDLISLLNSGMKKKNPIYIGNLITRQDVKVFVSADEMVSRHVLVIGMTGAGKSVWVRRAVRELMQLLYPILIIDPHGDNLGSVQKAKILFPDTIIKLFYPKIF